MQFCYAGGENEKQNAITLCRNKRRLTEAEITIYASMYISISSISCGMNMYQC